MWKSVRAAAVAALLVGLMPVVGLAPKAAASATLPALPSAWPYNHLEVGLTDAPNGAQSLRQTTSLKLRYQYLCGGVNTGSNGWAHWNDNGQFVDYYVQESMAYGFTPVFIYYQVLQSNPGWADFTGGSVSEKQADLENLANATTMKAYYADVRLLFQHLNAYATSTAVDMEPDLWGYIEQQSTNDDPTTVGVSVASSGDADVAGLPNNAAGFARALVKLRDQYAPNVMLGYELSTWGTLNDPIAQNLSLTQIDALAARSSNFQKALGASFDLVFTDPNDRDAAFKQIIYGDGGAGWWDSADYDRFNRYVGDFVAGTGKRMVLWQVPLGNTKMRAMDNSWGHYQDNHVETWFGDGTSANLTAVMNTGVVAILYGGGADGTTAAADAQGDGVTNPATINGNSTLSYSADDDGGYFRHQAAAYYATGPLALPDGPATTGTSLVVSGYANPDVAGVLHSFTVRAVNASGATVTGYAGTIHFSSSDPAAVLPADYTFTAADSGTHRFSSAIALKTAGTQTITATDVASASTTGAQSGIAVQPGPVKTFAVTNYPNPDVAGVAHSFYVRALDAFGNTNRAYRGTVHISSSDAKAVLPPDYTFDATDQGIHRFVSAVTLKTAGTAWIRATDTVSAAITGEQGGIVVGPGAVKALVVSGFPNPDIAGATHTFSVKAVDAYGNTVPSYAGTVHITTSDAKAVPPADYTFTGADAGVHRFAAALTLKTAGTAWIRATDTATATITGQQTGIVVQPNVARTFAVAGYPNPAAAGVAAAVTVTALDAYGNVATGYVGTVHLTSDDASATLPVDYAFAPGDAGVHAFTVTLRTSGTRWIRVTDTVKVSLTGAQTSILVVG